MNRDELVNFRYSIINFAISKARYSAILFRDIKYRVDLADHQQSDVKPRLLILQNEVSEERRTS